jgi:hypothetical protein
MSWNFLPASGPYLSLLGRRRRARGPVHLDGLPQRGYVLRSALLAVPSVRALGRQRRPRQGAALRVFHLDVSVSRP